MALLTLSLVVVFGLIFLLGLVSSLTTNRLPVSEPLVAVAVGAALELFLHQRFGVPSHPVSRSLFHGLAAITLAIALMTTALQVPDGYLRQHWRQVLLLLGIGMPAMWILSGAALSLALGLPLGVAALAAAAISPTDPVLASTIVTGDLAEANIAGRIRHLIIVESGINDGLAYVFLLLPLNLLTHPLALGLWNWFLYSALWEVGGALLFGVALGLATGWLTNLALQAEATEHTSFLGLTLALALLSYGALELIGTDALLGVFAAGLAFRETLSVRGQELQRAEHVQQAVERFFILPVFVLLGAVLPWQAWLRLGWRAIAAVLLVLAFRRIPVTLVLTRWLHPALETRVEGLFVGWFGPMRISALFYATLNLPNGLLAQVWPVITLMILASIVAHGVTATTLTRAFGRYSATRAPTHRDDANEQDERAALIESLAEQVRTRVRESTRAVIQAVLWGHLQPSQADPKDQSSWATTGLSRALIHQRAYDPSVGSAEEISEAIADEIAVAVADEVSHVAAQAVAARVTKNLEDDHESEDAHTDASNQSEQSSANTNAPVAT